YGKKSAIIKGFLARLPRFLGGGLPLGGRVARLALPFARTSSRSFTYASLRSSVHRPSGPKRASARHGRALPGIGHRPERYRAPPGRLGPSPTGLPHSKARQGPLRLHEHRVRPSHAG